MKDLTHYFASPEKSRVNVDNAALIDLENLNANVNQNESGTSECAINTKDKIGETELKERRESPSKKRSRVKIKISVKDKKNRRCDIIVDDDVVDKTPSPYKQGIRKMTSNDKMLLKNTNVVDNEAVHPHEETCDAFKLLMTRGKTTTLESRINRSEEKLGVKRKHVEIEESESDPKKRTKLVRRNDEAERETEKPKKTIERKKKPKDAAGIKNTKNERNADSYESNNDKKKKIEACTADCRNGKVDRIKILKSEGESASLGKDQTPKSIKTKWMMRVKLQSHSNDERDTENGGTSEEDYIFSPKSEVKFRKTRIRKNSGDGEGKDRKKPLTEKIKENEKDETVIADLPQSKRNTVSLEKRETKDLRRGKHRAKKNRNKLKTSELNINEESKQNINKNSSPYADGKSNDFSIIVLDDSITEIDDCTIILREKKLAPLFVKASKPNPAILTARQNFLHSGIPENVKKIISEQKLSSSNDTEISTMPFPLISHVSQSDSELDSVELSASTFYKHKLDCRPVAATLSLDPSHFKSLSKSGEKNLPELVKTDEKNVVKIERTNFESVLKDIESRCPDTRTMWETISATSMNLTPKKSPKKRNKKLKSQRKSDVLNFEENPDNLNPTWTCKYKPMSSVDVVGNETAIAKLRNWLSGWRLPSNKDDYSSGDEFHSSDCSNSSFYENNQVAVLLGPHGSGKSASVYAIAEELGYRVLEVNASSRRTGKKILTNFQEATKSHRVKRDQMTLLPIKKRHLEKKVPQNSLLLIEDVDLIFEGDEGFVSATFQLATNTRRPIVMTCEEPCSHLNRMAPQQQFIQFQTATGNRVSALLELIALAESRYRLPRYCSDILLRNGDLRQSLLQLQYILLSGPPSISQLGINARATLWVDMYPLIYKPALKSSKKYRKESNGDKLHVAERDAELVKTLANKLDNVSLVSSLTDVDNPTSPPWKRKLKPSLSFVEDYEPYSNSTDLSDEIAEWLRIASLESESMISIHKTNLDAKSQLAIKRKVKLGIDLALSQAVPTSLEHRSKATDYLPVIRTMCRLELNRAQINTKRGNRFHNYLHGLNLASASSNILTAASSIFQEKSTS